MSVQTVVNVMRICSEGCLKRFDRPGGAYASSLGCRPAEFTLSLPKGRGETPGPRCIASRAPEGRTRPLLPRLLLMTLHAMRPPLPTSPKQLRRLNRGGKNNRDTYRGFRPSLRQAQGRLLRTPPPATHVCPLRGNNEPTPTLRCLFTYLWGAILSGKRTGSVSGDTPNPLIQSVVAEKPSTRTI